MHLFPQEAGEPQPQGEASDPWLPVPLWGHVTNSAAQEASAPPPHGAAAPRGASPTSDAPRPLQAGLGRTEQPREGVHMAPWGRVCSITWETESSAPLDKQEIKAKEKVIFLNCDICMHSMFSNKKGTNY